MKLDHVAQAHQEIQATRTVTKPLKIEEVPVPEVVPGQILVKIAASGVCHTDLHAADGDWPVKPFAALHSRPRRRGPCRGRRRRHQAREGRRPRRRALAPYGVRPLRTLHHWMENLCDRQQMTGYTVNGGYAEYVLADPGYIGHLPANIGFSAIAPILCAGVTVYKGLKVLDCRPGDWVAISGVGGLRHLAVQYAKAMGFHVVAVDVDDAKLTLAKKVGADMVVNAATGDPIKELQSSIKGAHGVLVTAASRPAFSQALGMLHKRGTDINKAGMAMLMGFVVSFGFILPINAPQNMVCLGTDTFDGRQFAKTGIVLTLAGYLLMLLFAMTYWRWLGWM